ncbi:MAG: helix-turn-helix domain-containing protein [Actinophytocola sp.]|nr:helix-turn-helix domain-containing protein [Actinophytocola sp.]
MQTNADPPIGQLIRSARQRLKISQYELADRLAAISGKATMGRDRVARWERGRQVPRDEWRQWLSVALQIPKSTLDAGAAAARRRSQLGHAAVTANPPVNSNTSRRNQGSPALLPVFRSRVQAGILAATLMNPNRAFSLTELADHAGGSLASVSKESDLLEAAGILARRNEGTVRLVRAVTDRPIVGPLTALIRVTYGVPQVLGEKLGRVPGITRITVCSTWVERFAGLPGIDPTTIQIRLTVPDEAALDEPELAAAIERASRRIHREIKHPLVGVDEAQTEVNGVPIPRQRDRRPVVDVAVLRRPAGHPSIVASWEQGQDVVSALLDEGQLELISGTDADATPFFDLAESHLEAADQLATSAPASAFRLVCEAAQLIGSGMLGRQGLRPAANSASNVASRAVTAQFGLQFSQIELLRQRALELATPTSRDNRATASDVADYAPTVRSLLDAARTLAPRMGVYA